jgi:hypothetical protein
MTYYPAIQGPIAPYSNLPIAPQNFNPSQFAITALSYGTVTTVTMANGTNGVAPNFVVGQLVRLLMPSAYGARQLNEQLGYVSSIPTSSSVVVTINSIGTDPFIPSPTFLPSQSQTLPQIVAVGDSNSGQINTSGTMGLGTSIPGSFINVSS